MPPHAIVFDCEFLTTPDSPSRFWCGPQDPDPVVAQIGLVRIDLNDDFAINETRRLFVIPKDRNGARRALDPFFTKLTGISEEQISEHGLPLAQALNAIKDFAGEARLWSWGKDEFNMVAISCYMEGLSPPIPVSSFGNACDLLLKAGMPLEDLIKTRSNTLAEYYQIEHPPLKGHDARDDALSVAYTLQHLLREKQLTAGDFA